MILAYFYVQISSLHNKDFKKHLIIYLSLLIHFYFSLILIGIFFLEKIIKLKKLKIEDLISSLSLITVSLFVMYIIGYFTIGIDDGLGFGYGFYNFNLNSFFNPQGSNYTDTFNWSFFLPALNFQNQEKEGFSYLGISGIIFFLLYLKYLFNGKSEIIFSKQTNILIFFIFLIFATSNNINFGNQSLITIELNKYFYAVLSSIRASGRLIWPIYYLIFIIGIVCVFQYNFNKKKAIFIISILAIFQLVDLAPGISKYYFGKQYIYQNKINNDIVKHIQGLSKEFKEIKTFKSDNSKRLYFQLTRHLLNENYKRSSIYYVARVDRQEITNKDYDIIKKLNNKSLDLFNETLFVSDDYNLVRNVFYLFREELNYYKVNELWLLSKKKIYKLASYDYKNEFKFYEIKNFFDDNLKLKNLLGFGWEIDKNNQVIMNGYESSLIFNIKKNNCKNDSKLVLKFQKYFNQTKDPMILKVLINEILYDNTTIKNNFDVKINLSEICQKNEELKIDLVADNPKSLFDLRVGLNRKKRSIILNKVQLKN